MKKNLSLSILLVAAGCLPAAGLSTPLATLRSLDCHIQAIDGQATHTFFRPQFEIAPGVHTIQVDIDPNPQSQKVSSRRKRATVRFTAKAGHNYEIYKDKVIDLTSKYEPYDPEEDEQAGVNSTRILYQ